MIELSQTQINASSHDSVIIKKETLSQLLNGLSDALNAPHADVSDEARQHITVFLENTMKQL